MCDRTLRAGGPALLFESPVDHDIPVLANLFGTPRRVALAMGVESTDALREIGRLLAFLKAPDPPRGMRDAWKSLPAFRRVLDMAPRTVEVRTVARGHTGGRGRRSRPLSHTDVLAPTTPVR